MSSGVSPVDPRWHRLLGLAVHEFRTPVTVVAGYIRMLLTGRVGEMSDQQRRLLQEAEKSCGRLSALIAEMSDLANLEAGSATFNRSALDVGTVMDEAIAALPPLPDREITVVLTNDAPGAAVLGDTTRLRTAFAAVLVALRRELVTSARLFVRHRRKQQDGGPQLWIAIADEDHIEAVSGSDDEALGTFDEWRGGCGLSLAVARRIINAHDGWLWSPDGDPKSGAVIVLPLKS